MAFLSVHPITNRTYNLFFGNRYQDARLAHAPVDAFSIEHGVRKPLVGILIAITVKCLSQTGQNPIDVVCGGCTNVKILCLYHLLLVTQLSFENDTEANAGGHGSWLLPIKRRVQYFAPLAERSERAKAGLSRTQVPGQPHTRAGER
jgi:hypothetical protein